MLTQIVIGIAIAISALAGFFFYTRHKQKTAGKVPEKTLKEKEEVQKLEEKKSEAGGQLIEQHAQIDAIAKKIQENKGAMEGISKEVAGMSSTEVDAELKKRGLL